MISVPYPGCDEKRAHGRMRSVGGAPSGGFDLQSAAAIGRVPADTLEASP